MPVKLYVKDGKISNSTTMGNKLERLVEAGIVGGTNDFGLDFVEKTDYILENHSKRGSSTLKKDGFGTYI